MSRMTSQHRPMGRRPFGFALLGAAALLPLATACGDVDDSLTYQPGPSGTDTPAPGPGNASSGSLPSEEPAGPSAVLDQREFDYGAALRIATLKLTGHAPTLETLKALTAASDKKAFYTEQIDLLLAAPAFATTQRAFWRNTFKTGGADADGIAYDAAATFAAQVVVEGRPFTELFTAQSGTCPSLDAATGEFTAADCAANGPTAGVLGDRALMAQYYAPLAFRRVRFIQETFACAALPLERGESPQPFGAGVYTGPYPLTTISGALTLDEPRVDFHDNTSTMCVNCHVTLNHAAPLFANYTETGEFRDTIQVKLPDEQVAELSDWLPEGESTAWRYGVPAADLATYGAAMAADPEVARCTVTRAWNFAFSRGNVVDDASPVSRSISDPLLVEFVKDHNYKKLLRSIFTSEDFTKF